MIFRIKMIKRKGKCWIPWDNWKHSGLSQNRLRTAGSMIVFSGLVLHTGAWKFSCHPCSIHGYLFWKFYNPCQGPWNHRVQVKPRSYLHLLPMAFPTACNFESSSLCHSHPETSRTVSFHPPSPLHSLLSVSIMLRESSEALLIYPVSFGEATIKLIPSIIFPQNWPYSFSCWKCWHLPMINTVNRSTKLPVYGDFNIYSFPKKKLLESKCPNPSISLHPKLRHHHISYRDYCKRLPGSVLPFYSSFSTQDSNDPKTNKKWIRSYHFLA